MLVIWYVALSVVLYQVCSNEGLGFQNGPVSECPGFKP